MAIDITKGIEPFEDRMDTTRSNPDRKQWGKSDNTSGLNLGNEYDTALPDTPPAPLVPPPPADTPPAPKFTHKLSNGETLEAASFEELATKIEKALQQSAAPVPVEYDEAPIYKPYDFKPKDLTLAEQAEILNLWKENPQAAMRKLQEADLGAPTNVVIQKMQEIQSVLRVKLEEEAGAEFMGDCEDYLPTVRNGKKLNEYLTKLGKPITRKNLGIAFRALVAAGDKAMVRPAEEPVPPAPAVVYNATEVPPPPTIVPSNMGLPVAPPKGQVDAVAFSKMSLDQQKNYFSNLRRQGR